MPRRDLSNAMPGSNSEFAYPSDTPLSDSSSQKPVRFYKKQKAKPTVALTEPLHLKGPRLNHKRLALEKKDNMGKRLPTLYSSVASVGHLQHPEHSGHRSHHRTLGIKTKPDARQNKGKFC
jgi:hypothetical protein